MSILARIASSTPHTPETPNVIGLYAALVMSAYLAVNPHTFTLGAIAEAYGGLITAVGVGALASGGQRKLQGDKSVPEPSVTPA